MVVCGPTGRASRPGLQSGSNFRFRCYRIPNYGEQFRAGERIASAMAESTVNAVVSKRFAKRQQMQWTRLIADLLLQTRTYALDGTLRPLFERWYPGLVTDNSPSAGRAAAA